MFIKNVALIGMGAIGSVYGKHLYEAYENDFVVIAGGTRAQRIETMGVSVNGKVFFPKVVTPEEKRWKADLVLVCVKNEQLEDAMTDIRNVMGTNTIILSLLSGVSAVNEIQKKYPDNVTLSGMAMGIDVARENENIVNSSMGRLDISAGGNSELFSVQIDAVKKCLEDAGITSEVLNNASLHMWKRWLFNVGVNQVASILGLKYGQIYETEFAVALMKQVMHEAIQITREIDKMGVLKIELGPEDIEDAIDQVEIYPTFSKPSMLQDFEAKRKTEVEAFSGIILNLSKKLELSTPLNRTVYELVKAKEQMYHLDKVI